MRLRQLVLACGLTSLVLSPCVSALGLGEVKLKSTLNQPLEAEVKLLDTRDLTAEQILVALASPADFERNGVDRLFFYTEFQFQVDLAAAGGPKVVITSRNPVREPYLNFLVEARWTAGRLLREYTLLMDLPTFEDDASTAAVQSAVTNTRSQQPRTAAPNTTQSSGSGESRQASTTSPASLSGDEYQVRSNDTLWEIALRARADSSVSVHQSMMALYRANPDAFINGDINKLRRGQVLRVPGASDMKSLGKSEAVSQFAQASGDSNFGAQLNASRRTSSATTEPTGVSGQVKLAAPSAGTTSAGQGSGANDGTGKALESELAVTLEELDKSKAENTELSSRVKDLEAQIQTMERLVDVSNEKLRALQVAAVQPTTDTSASTPAVETPVTPPVTSEPTAEVAAVASSEAVSSSSAAAVPPPTPPKKVIVPPKPAPSLVDTAVENAPWIGLGVLGLVGAGYFVYRRRKQAEEELAEEENDVFTIDDSATEHEELVSETESRNEIDEDSLFDEGSETTAVAETGDVVGEADIYIAYGKLDQAEEMLVNALQKDPNSTDIRMKLLEVYAQQQNSSAFDKHYAALLPLAGGVLLARASELREGISGAGEFDPVLSVNNESLDSELDQFSLDDFRLDDDVTASPAPVAEANEVTSFDFDLDLDDDETDLVPPVAAQTEVATEYELDFDDDLTVATEADDLSELSLALDDLAADTLPEDREARASSDEDEFNFDLDDELGLDESLQEETLELVSDESESLDVSADDFNLDMDVDDVDLAALDHEMESLDLDLNDDALTERDSVVHDLSSVSELELDDLDLTESKSLESEISSSKLSLTDDLDKSDELSFDLSDDLAEFSLEDATENLDEDFAVETESLEKIGSDELLSDFDLDDDKSFSLDEEITLEDDELELVELEEDLDQLSEAAEVADIEFTADDELVELQDETPDEPVSIEEIPAVIAEKTELVEADEERDEDLFSQALSDFSGESDDIDLNEFSSDEAALADLSDDDMDAELDFLADADEAATKLDLARAYIDMGDSEGAKDILSEVLGEGNDEQRKEANELLGRIG